MLRALRGGPCFPRFWGRNEQGRRKGLRRLSYLHQCGNTSLMYKSVGQLFDETAEKFGDRTAYVSTYQKQRVSFLEARKKADDLAAGILAKGIEKGDRVGLWAVNSIEWYITSIALAKAGIISVYLNPLYQALEMEHCMNAVGVKMLIMNDTFRNQNYTEILTRVVPEFSTSEPGKLKSNRVPSLESVVCISDKDIPGAFPYQLLAEGGTDSSRKKLKEFQELINPEDANNIQFTSGTTGSPKGVTLSHFHTVNNSYFTAKRQQLSDKKYVMCFMGPLFHAMGSVVGILTCLHDGITLVVPERTFSPSTAAQAIMDEKCTILLGTPTMYVDVMKVMQEKGLKPQVEIAMSGGAYAPVKLVNDIQDILGAKRFTALYGLTETGPICFLSKPTDSREAAATTVGFIMEHTEAKVVDENGRTVPWGMPGELWVRGYNIMKGYWGQEEKTRETITSDYWLKTGDQFVLTKDGYGRIVGRIKDMIIRGGENIFPSEIEEFLSAHPDIIDVQVVGLPDERLGEQVCACVRLKDNATLTKEDLKAFCKGKIADFKIPEYIYIVKDFPKTPSGKIQKFKLRIEAMKHFNLTEIK